MILLMGHADAKLLAGHAGGGQHVSRMLAQDARYAMLVTFSCSIYTTGQMLDAGA